MAKLVVITRAGAERVLENDADVSAMEAMRSGGIDEVLALCGGCLSCATCHVYVDPGDLELVTPMSEYEEELLDTISFRRPTSRMSCQIRLADLPGGLKLTVAPEE